MSGIRLEDKYMAIKELHEEKQFTIYELCNSMKLQRSTKTKQKAAGKRGFS